MMDDAQPGHIGAALHMASDGDVHVIRSVSRDGSHGAPRAILRGPMTDERKRKVMEWFLRMERGE